MTRFHIISTFPLGGQRAGNPATRSVVIPLFDRFLGERAIGFSIENLPRRTRATPIANVAGTVLAASERRVESDRSTLLFDGCAPVFARGPSLAFLATGSMGPTKTPCGLAARH